MTKEKNKFITIKIIFIVIGLLLALMSSFYLKYSWDSGIEERENVAKIIAESAADGLNGIMLKELRGQATDVNKEAYQSIKGRLNKLLTIDSGIRFAYFYTLRDGSLYFMVDSEPIGSPDESPAGQKYEEAERELYNPFFNKETIITKEVKDRWGSWRTVLVPIANNEGEIFSVFAIDYPAEIWTDLALKNLYKSTIFVFLAYIILFSLYLITKSQVEIKKSYAQYHNLITNSNDIIYKITYKGIFSFVSPAWTRLLGHEISEVEGHLFTEFIHPDDLPLCFAFLEKVLKTKKRQDGLEYRIKHKNGEWLWHSTSAAPVINDFGLVLSGDCIARDITYKKHTEEKIKNNLKQQKLLADISVDLNKYGAGKKTIVNVLKRMGEYSGVDRAYIFEDDFEQQTTSNTYEWCAKGIKPEINNLQDLPYDNKLTEFVASIDSNGIFSSSDTSILPSGLKEILLPQGIKAIVIVPLLISGKKVGFIGFDQVKKCREWEDNIIYLLKTGSNVISFAMEKEKHLESISKEKEKIQTIVQGIGDAVFVVDRYKKLILFNKKSEALSGYSYDEAINKPYKEVLNFIFEKDGKVNDAFIDQAFATGENQEMTNHTLLVRKDGVKIAVSDSAAPLKDRNNNIIGCVVVFRDVSREREIDKMKSEFISVASHQLKTPLAGIKWMCEILIGGKVSKPSKEQKEYLSDIYTSNERMIKLVNDLLDVSHIETGRKFDVVKKNTDIVGIVDEILSENKQLILEKQINIIKCKGAPKNFFLDIDGEKIKQAYNNLINNAIKYSNLGGQIEIGCEHKEESVIFIIKDHGIGIPKNQQNKIFSKFFRADNASTQETDGTGLGLYIAKSIIEAHGGKIWFESTEKVGTTFYFELPIK